MRTWTPCLSFARCRLRWVEGGRNNLSPLHCMLNTKTNSLWQRLNTRAEDGWKARCSIISPHAPGKCEATPVVFTDMEVWIRSDLWCTTEAKMQCMQKHVPMLSCKSLAGKSPMCSLVHYWLVEQCTFCFKNIIMKQIWIAQCSKLMNNGTSTFRRIHYKPYVHWAILFLPPGTKSPRKTKADWRSAPAGRLAPFLYAVTSPLEPDRRNQFLLLSCDVAICYSEEKRVR